MQKVIFRTDGSTAIGMGHVVRCLALADMLSHMFKIVFAVQETDENVINIIREVSQQLILLPVTSDYISDASTFVNNINESDIVVLDGYNFNSDYQKKILSKPCKLVCIDDLHAWHHVADVIINHSQGLSDVDYSTEPYTKIYTGFDYALLRKSFLEKTDVLRKIQKIGKIFISIGAADVNNISQKFIGVLAGVKGLEEIHIMVGSVNIHLKELKSFSEKIKNVRVNFHENISQQQLSNLLKQCDVAFCPASSIALECCATGIPLFTGLTADNQLGILNGILKFNAGINMGNFLTVPDGELKALILKYFNDLQYLNEQMINQGKMIDGKSPERINKIFTQLAKQHLRFRFADMNDEDLYFRWTNDPLVRLNSFNQKLITYEEHVRWFRAKVNSPDCSLYVFTNLEHVPVGQVRIENGKDEVVIGISLDKEFRGKSFGTEMLELATSDYLRKNPNATICAYIKDDNQASLGIFGKSGFKGRETLVVNGIPSFKLYKNLQ